MIKRTMAVIFAALTILSCKKEARVDGDESRTSLPDGQKNERLMQVRENLRKLDNHDPSVAYLPGKKADKPPTGSGHSGSHRVADWNDWDPQDQQDFVTSDVPEYNYEYDKGDNYNDEAWLSYPPYEVFGHSKTVMWLMWQNSFGWWYIFADTKLFKDEDGYSQFKAIAHQSSYLQGFNTYVEYSELSHEEELSSARYAAYAHVKGNVKFTFPGGWTQIVENTHYFVASSYF